MRPARVDDFRLPELRFVPTGSLISHERHDSQRLGPLLEQLEERGVLQNPPIVTPLPPDGGHERYMVLDGANRSTAVASAGYPHVVVQIVKYEEPWVTLGTWDHALSEAPIDHLTAACARLPGLQSGSAPILHAQAQLARREALAFVTTDDRGALVFRGGRNLEERNQLLNGIVDVYREGRRFYRMSTESFEVARERHSDVTALVVFPHFAPAEVLELANGGAKLPAGITRHLIRWRALRVNVPLARLADRDQSREAKNAWLDAWLKDRFHRRQVRFYEEPTVLFDE